MRRIVWVLGPSGVGKTTIVRHVLGPNPRVVNRWSIGAHVAAAGPYIGLVLDGPDQLPRSRAVVERMLDRIETTIPAGLPVLLDGLRFGAWAGEYVRGRAHRVAALLTASTSTLVRRRRQRGSPPIPPHKLEAQGRTARRIAEALDELHEVDTELQPSATMAAFAAALRGSR